MIPYKDDVTTMMQTLDKHHQVYSILSNFSEPGLLTSTSACNDLAFLQKETD
jgi:hypothetical protein